MMMLQIIGGQRPPDLQFTASNTSGTDGTSVNHNGLSIGAEPTTGDRLIILTVGASIATLATSATINGNAMTQVAWVRPNTFDLAAIYTYVLNSGTTANFTLSSANNFVTTGVGVYAAYNLESTTVRDTDTGTGSQSVTVLDSSVAVMSLYGANTTGISGLTTLTTDYSQLNESVRFAAASADELSAGTLTENPTGGNSARCLATWR